MDKSQEHHAKQKNLNQDYIQYDGNYMKSEKKGELYWQKADHSGSQRSGGEKELTAKEDEKAFGAEGKGSLS